MQKHYEEDVSRETSSFYSYLEIVKERKMEIIKIVRRERNLLEILMIIGKIRCVIHMIFEGERY